MNQAVPIVAIYRQHTSKAVRDIAISASLTALCACAFQFGLLGWRWGLGGAAIGGVVTLAFGIRLLRRQPQLVVAADGITVPQYGRVGWSEIAQVNLRRNNSGEVYRLDFLLADPAATLSHVSWLVRSLMHPSAESEGHNVIDVHLTGIPESLETIIGSLRQQNPTVQISGLEAAPTGE